MILPDYQRLQPIGKNDGSYNGHAYFACKPSHGVFSVPDKVHPAPPPSEPTAAAPAAAVKPTLTRKDGSVLDITINDTCRVDGCTY